MWPKSTATTPKTLASSNFDQLDDCIELPSSPKTPYISFDTYGAYISNGMLIIKWMIWLRSRRQPIFEAHSTIAATSEENKHTQASYLIQAQI